jgi:hypothetical protein
MAGDDFVHLARFMAPGGTRYAASDVLARILNAPS